MRLNTACFEGFKVMIEKAYDLVITEDSYSADHHGFINHWNNRELDSLAEVYSQAWNTSANFYNRFGRNK